MGASAGNNASSAAGPLCLTFYNHLNLISHHLNVHQQKRQQLPSSSAAALKDISDDLQKRKDELIRQRHGLRQCQKKIFDFHMEQVDKRAKNFDTFVKSHRTHWQEMKDKREAITDEIRNAEEELKAMLEDKPSKDQTEQGEDAKSQDDAGHQREGSQSAAQQLQEAN